MELTEKSRMSFLILGFLILFATLDSSIACSRRGRWGRRRFHRRHSKREVDYNDYQDTNLAYAAPCGESLCEGVEYYPHFQVNDIVNEVRRLLQSGNPVHSKKFLTTFSNTISKLQVQMEYERNKVYPTETHHGCKMHKQTIIPQVGISSDDGKEYYIVNLPSMRQTVTELKCRSEQMCKDSSGKIRGQCSQAYREQELVTLPVGLRKFHINDFGINKFVIPYGCECVATNENDINAVQVI